MILIYHRVGARTASQVDLPTALLRRAGRRAGGSRARGAPRRGARAPRRGPSSTIGPWSSPSTTAPPTGWTRSCRCSSATGRRPRSTSPPTSSSAGVPFPGDGHADLVGRARRAGGVGAGHDRLAHPHPRAARPGRRARRPRPSSTGRSSSSASASASTCAHFAYPKALLGSPAAEGEVRRPVPLRDRRRQPAEPAGRRPPPPPPHADPGGRRHALVPPQGRRRAVPRGCARSLLNRGRYAGATT